MKKKYKAVVFAYISFAMAPIVISTEINVYSLNSHCEREKKNQSRPLLCVAVRVNTLLMARRFLLNER